MKTYFTNRVNRLLKLASISKRISLIMKSRSNVAPHRQRGKWLVYDRMESREMLAASAMFDAGTNTLTIEQTVDDGAMTVDNLGAANEFRVTDGSGTTTFQSAINVVVKMLDNTSNVLNFALGNPHSGDVTLKLGDGARIVNFTGTSNNIGNDLLIRAGAGDQTVELAAVSNFSVDGNVRIDLGAGVDMVDEDNRNISVLGNMHLINVNAFENGGVMTVGGDVVVAALGETGQGVNFDNDLTMNIGGNFSFYGNDGSDLVQTNQDFNLTGNFLAVLGDGGAAPQDVNLNSTTIDITGDVRIISSNASGLDQVRMSGSPPNLIGGSLSINLGDGTNSAEIQQSVAMNTIRYVGGSGADTVNFAPVGDLGITNIVLGGGDDVFNLDAGVTGGSRLRVDFGGGFDSVANNIGATPVDLALLNFYGMNGFYTATSGDWTLNQSADLGDIVLIYDVFGSLDIAAGGGTHVLGPANGVNVNLMDHTGNLSIDVAGAMTSPLNVNLGAGDRMMTLSGSSNTFDSALRIIAGDGAQSVNLAANSPLVVNGVNRVELGGGSDTVTASQDLTFNGPVVWRGVNRYENAVTVNASDNFLFDVSSESVDTRFDNDGSMNVVGKFIFEGGMGQDDILLNDGVTVGEAYVDVGTGMGFPGQLIDLSGGFQSLGRVTVIGGDTFGGNQFATDATTIIMGDLVVDFSSTTVANQAVFDGTYQGSYGVFRGGQDSDSVIMDAVASDMDFILRLAGGSDTFNLGSGTDLAFLYADFGAAFDTFIDGFNGAYPFPVSLVQYP